MFNTILVAYDGSDHAEHALKTAAELAKTFSAKIHLAHCPQVDTPPIVIGSFVSLLDTPPTKAQIEEAGRHIAEKAAGEAKALGVEITEIHLGIRDPAAHVLKVAKSTDADLIVMGRRGLGAIGSLAMGSVSLEVAHGAPCACLTVV